MYKKCKVIRIPSEETQHLYIISDEEIKEGDWYIATDKIEKCESKEEANNLTNNCRKIIATTNEFLCPIVEERYSNGEKKGLKSQIILPQPSKKFIEKYVAEYNKNNVITDVLVEYDLYKSDPFEDSHEGDWQTKNIEVLKINIDNTISIKILK